MRFPPLDEAGPAVGPGRLREAGSVGQAAVEAVNNRNDAQAQPDNCRYPGELLVLYLQGELQDGCDDEEDKGGEAGEFYAWPNLIPVHRTCSLALVFKTFSPFERVSGLSRRKSWGFGGGRWVRGDEGRMCLLRGPGPSQRLKGARGGTATFTPW